MKRRVALSAAAIVAALELFACSVRRPIAPATPAETGPAVPTVRARIGAIERTVVAVGRIGPPTGDAKLAFASSGILAGVDVVTGQRVVAGQTLATLDRRSLAAARDQARADAAVAEASYAGGATARAAETSARAKLVAAATHLRTLRTGGLAALSDRISAASVARQTDVKTETDRRALARAATLFAGGVSPAKDVDAARSALADDIADARAARAKVAAAGASYDEAVRVAEADAAQARSDLASARSGAGAAAAQRTAAIGRLAGAEADYARGTLVAPSDGTIASVIKHPGEAVDATMPVIDFVPPLDARATLTLPAAYASNVHIGDVATLADTSGTRGAATVSAVVPLVDAVSQTTTIVLRGRMPSAIAGSTVTATISIGTTRGVLVPATAIVTDPGTGGTVVFVRHSIRNAGFDAYAVNVRAADGTSAIVSGIRAGETIAKAGAYDLLAPAGG